MGEYCSGNEYGAFIFLPGQHGCVRIYGSIINLIVTRNFWNKTYNTLLGAALFWVDNLWTDERDGTLVANPSHSPEHGEYSLGCSTVQAMIAEIFDIVIKASKVWKRYERGCRDKGGEK